MVITLADVRAGRGDDAPSGEVNARVDAVQRGRTAMDTMTRQLRSQVCLQQRRHRDDAQAALDRGRPPRLGDVLRRHARHLAAGDAADAARRLAHGPERRRMTLVSSSAIPRKRWKLVEAPWTPSTCHAVPATYTYAEPLIVRERRRLDQPHGRDGTEPALPVLRLRLRPRGPAAERASSSPAPALRPPSSSRAVAKIKITYRAQPGSKRAPRPRVDRVHAPRSSSAPSIPTPRPPS